MADTPRPLDWTAQYDGPPLRESIDRFIDEAAGVGSCPRAPWNAGMCPQDRLEEVTILSWWWLPYVVAAVIVLW